MPIKKHLLQSINFIKNSRELQKLLGFGFFIHCNWGALGAILPLWFEQAKSFENFAYYYSTLTFVAGTSFLWTNVIDKLEIKKLSFVLSFLYLIRGILLLFSTNIGTAILSGACGGTCIIFYTLISRTWIDDWEDEKEKSHVIGWTNSEFRIANVISVSLAGLGLSLSGTKTFGLSTLILLSSIIPFISYFFLKKSELKIVQKPIVPVFSKIYYCFQLYKKLLLWTLACNLFSGLHIGLVNPYFSILLNKVGFNPAMSLSLISMGSFLKIFCQPVFSTLYRPQQKAPQMLGTGILYALLLGIWAANFSTQFLIPIVLLTIVMQTAFAFFESNIYYTIFPKDWSLQLFTLGSFLFHLGNIGGSFFGNWLISNWDIKYLIFTGSHIIVLSGLLYYLFIKSLKPSSHLAEPTTQIT